MKITLHKLENFNGTLRAKQATFTIRKKGTAVYRKQTYPDLYEAISSFLQWSPGFLVEDFRVGDLSVVLTDGDETKTLLDWLKDFSELSCSFGTIALTVPDCDEPEYLFSNQMFEFDGVGVVLQWPTLSKLF